MKNRGTRIPPKRLLRYFESVGGFGRYTKTYDRHSDFVQGALSKAVVFDSDEVPVIACFFDEYRWTLLTTIHLLFREGDEITTIPIADFLSVEIPESIKQEYGWKKIVDTILINTASDKQFSIRVETGGPYFGFLNILLLVSKQKR